MLINLAFIKAVNGLFYYALDYIAALQETTSAVLVSSPELADAVRQHFPTIPLRCLSPFAAAVAVMAAGKRSEMVFTPSPHPIPGASAQLVVVHDSYPFDGTKGAMKAAMFFMAMRTSQSTGGYINSADARAFLLKGGLPSDRLRSAPNRMALPTCRPYRKPLLVTQQPSIGLCGTDSAKKNYHRLFAAIAKHTPRSNLAFRLFGLPNDYTADVIAAFPGLDIALTSSRETGLEAFVKSVDIVASAATREGFNRPLALALALGIPCWVVDAPVIREFYGNAPTLYEDPTLLGEALAKLVPGTSLPRPSYAIPERLDRDFQECVDWLRMQDVYYT